MCANCHVVAVNVEFNSLEAVKRAITRLGWKFVQGQRKYEWFGNWVDDSPVPRHLFDSEDEYKRVVEMKKVDRQAYMNSLLGQCEHAIQVPGCKYEIGIIRKGNNFMPIWDWYDRKLAGLMGQEGGPLVQAYAAERAKLEAHSWGMGFVEEQAQDGTIKLHIQIPGD